MSIAAFLSDLRRREIEVRAEGDELRCAVRAGTLTPELREELRQRKNDILDFLRAAKLAASQQPAIVPLQANGDRLPVFAVPGHNGDVFCYRSLARCLGEAQPFYGLQPPGLIGDSGPFTRVDELAGYFAAQVRAFRPQGPCIVAGFCAGGAVAFELAQLLSCAGGQVAFVALFGSPFPAFFRPWMQRRYRIAQRMRSLGRHARAMAGKSWPQGFEYLAGKLRRRHDAPAPGDVLVERKRNVEEATLAAVRAYDPRPFAGTLCLFQPCGRWMNEGFLAGRWKPLARRAEEYLGPDGATGDDMLLPKNAAFFAELFNRAYANHGTAATIVPA
jgi:thioesterase domain-containing protein